MAGSRRLVVIGNPGSRRTALLADAVGRFPGVSLRLVPWLDLINVDADLRRIVKAGDVVRFDSPGRDANVERAMLRAGVVESGGDDPAFVSAERIAAYPDDRGRIRWPAQWARGFARTLWTATRQLEQAPSHRRTNHHASIGQMFDKSECHRRLADVGVPVAPLLSGGGRWSVDVLVGRMVEQRCPQVFAKLLFGSSASGAVALRLGRRQAVAYTTVEVAGRDGHGCPRLYNTRRIRRLTSVADIGAVVSPLSYHGLHVERWLPKAGIDGKAFDLRVVVIDGRACHVVPRLSSSPMTNLHLLNRRGDVDRVRQAVGEDGWAEAMAICERAVAAFPGTLHAGVDLMFQPGFRRPTVLEVNAFGDLLPGVLHDGMDTYTAELAAVFGRPAS